MPGYLKDNQRGPLFGIEVRVLLRRGHGPGRAAGDAGRRDGRRRPAQAAFPGRTSWSPASGCALSVPCALAFLVGPVPGGLGASSSWRSSSCFFGIGPSNTIVANVTHPSMRATGFAMNIFVIHVLGDADFAAGGRATSPTDSAGTLEPGFRAGLGLHAAWAGCSGSAASRYLQRDTAAAPHRLDGASEGAENRTPENRRTDL